MHVQYALTLNITYRMIQKLFLFRNMSQYCLWTTQLRYVRIGRSVNNTETRRNFMQKMFTKCSIEMC